PWLRARCASTVPAVDRKATVTVARLVAVPPSQPESRYRVPVATGWPAACRSATDWVSRAVPPAPPANRRPPRTAGHCPVARERGGAPWGTRVGSPLDPCQPGMVTAPQPSAEAAPACAPGLSSRLVPGPAAGWAAGPAGRAGPANAAGEAGRPITPAA